MLANVSKIIMSAHVFSDAFCSSVYFCLHDLPSCFLLVALILSFRFRHPVVAECLAQAIQNTTVCRISGLRFVICTLHPCVTGSRRKKRTSDWALALLRAVGPLFIGFS